MSSLVERSVWPSMVTLLSSHSTISRPSPRCPARPIASWLTPSIRQPSPAITQVLPQRPGGRLDAVDEEVLRVSGARAAELAECADVVHRWRGVAGQVEQR